MIIVLIKEIKGTLTGLRLFLETEIHLKMIKNAFYFTLKALFVLKIFKFFALTFWPCNKMASLERRG